MKNSIQLPDSFVKGLIVNVHVSLNGKTGTKQLKVCMVKTRSITFIEVDRENRQNIFRKVDRKDIVEFRPTAICEITVRDGILPVKWIVSDNHPIQYKVMVDLHKQLNHLVIIPKDGLRSYRQQQIRQLGFQWYKNKL
jgi:hypothetical protein